MTSVSDLRLGAELETKWGETLIVTDIDGDEITCEEDEKWTETYDREGMQRSIDDGTVKVISTGDTNEDGEGGDDGSHEPMEIIDTDVSEIDDSELYIRFGSAPESGQSYDNRNDRYEDGVSVYACERDTTDEDAPDDVDEAYYLAGTMLQTVFGLMARDIYLVTGEQVGTGADGEPVLADVEAVAELTTPGGVGGFVVSEN